MQILILDSHRDPHDFGAPRIVSYARDYGTVTVRRAPERDLPDVHEEYDCVIASGSKTSAMDESVWVQELVAFIARWTAAKKPFLGICFGHQMLARALGGVVGPSSTPEFCISDVYVTNPSELAFGLESSFSVVNAHAQCVQSLPPGMEKIFETAHCPLAGMRMVGAPIFSVQFHPERAKYDFPSLPQQALEVPSGARIMENFFRSLR